VPGAEIHSAGNAVGKYFLDRHVSCEREHLIELLEVLARTPYVERLGAELFNELMGAKLPDEQFDWFSGHLALSPLR